MTELTMERSQQYYARYFKIDALLNLIGKKNFGNREFSYETFQPLGKRFVWHRNLSFATPEELVTYMAKMGPRKLYFGAEYDRPLKPKVVTVDQAQWVQSHLRFDIDLDKSDSLRAYTCECKGKMMCNKCVELAKEGADFLIQTMADDFGIPASEAAIFFSGTRGLHIHYPNYKTFSNKLLDEIDPSLEIEDRRAIIRYLQLVKEEKGHTTVASEIPSPTLRKRMQQTTIPWFFAKISIEVLKTFPWDGINKSKAKAHLPKAKIESIISQIKRDMIIAISKKRALFNKSNADAANLYYATVEQNALKYRYPRYDDTPTYDIKKVIKVPMSVDFNTGYLIQEIKLTDLYSISMEDLCTIDHFLK